MGPNRDSRGLEATKRRVDKMLRKELCDHCGASMMENEYTMNRVLVRAMIKMLRKPGVPIRQLEMTKSEYAVVSKLKHWGLAHKAEDGVWVLSETGKSWLSGKGKIPRAIRYFRNKLTHQSPEMISVYEVMPTEESKQRYREMMTPYFKELT